MFKLWVRKKLGCLYVYNRARGVFIVGLLATLFTTPTLSKEPKLLAFERDIYLREDIADKEVYFNGFEHKVEGFAYNGGLETLFGGSPKKVAMNKLLKNARTACPLGFKLKDLRIADIHRGRFSGRYPNGAESAGDLTGAHLTHGGYEAVALCATVLGEPNVDNSSGQAGDTKP